MRALKALCLFALATGGLAFRRRALVGRSRLAAHEAKKTAPLLDPIGTVGSEELQEHFKAVDSVSTKSYSAGVRACKEDCPVRPYYNQSQLEVQYKAAAALFQLATGLPAKSSLGSSVDEINAELTAWDVTYKVIFLKGGDKVNNRSVYVLREVEKETCNPVKHRGVEGLPPCTFNGALMVADGPAQQLVIESPHPRFDMNTGRQGFWLFVRMQARFWMVNTAQRKGALVYKPGFEHGWGACDNPDGSGWGGTNDVAVTDPGHSPKSLLHVWHTALVDAGYQASKPFYVLQNHGFGGNTASFCKCDYQVSDGHGYVGDGYKDELGVVQVATDALNDFAKEGQLPDEEQAVNNGWQAKEWTALSCYGEAWPHECPPGPMDLDKEGKPRTCDSTPEHVDGQGVVCAKMNPSGQYMNLFDHDLKKGPSQYDDERKACTLADEGPGRSSGMFLHIEQSTRARQVDEKSAVVWEGFALAVQAAFDHVATTVEPRLTASA